MIFYKTCSKIRPCPCWCWGPPWGWGWLCNSGPRVRIKKVHAPRWSVWKTEWVGWEIFPSKGKLAVEQGDRCAFLLGLRAPIYNHIPQNNFWNNFSQLFPALHYRNKTSGKIHHQEKEGLGERFFVDVRWTKAANFRVFFGTLGRTAGVLLLT